MKRVYLSAAGMALVAALTLAPPAQAHTSLRSASIAEGAQLAESPRNFTMEYGAASGLAGIELTTAAGQRVPLDFTPPRAMSKTFTVPLPTLQQGAYKLSWRLMAGDGHVMTGAVNFSVGPGQTAAVAAPKAAAHGTHGGDSANMLASSNPADGATLATAPRTLALQFTHPVILQSVAITDARGTPVRATFRRAASPTPAYSIALPTLAAGAYSVRWSATGGGHPMQGSLRFSVQ